MVNAGKEVDVFREAEKPERVGPIDSGIRVGNEVRGDCVPTKAGLKCGWNHAAHHSADDGTVRNRSSESMFMRQPARDTTDDEAELLVLFGVDLCSHLPVHLRGPQHCRQVMKPARTINLIEATPQLFCTVVFRRYLWVPDRDEHVPKVRLGVLPDRLAGLAFRYGDAYGARQCAWEDRPRKDVPFPANSARGAAVGAWLMLEHGAMGLRGLTFEVRRDRREGARPGGGRIDNARSRAWCIAVGPRLDRGVRPHCRRALAARISVRHVWRAR
jgi:hypothetical protein